MLVEPDRREEALDWLAGYGMEGERSYMAIRHFRMGEIHEELGNRDQAVDRYERFIGYWRDGDPELQSQVEEARRRIRVLQAGR